MHKPSNDHPPYRLSIRRAAAAYLCAGLFFAATSAFAAPGMGTLRTAIAQSGQAQYSYVADASIEAIRDSHIAAQVAGRITDLLVQAGDRVAAGQVLMHIDPSIAAQQVAGSQAQLAQAQALLTAARADLARAQRLYAKDYLSKAALEHAEAQFQSAEAQARSLSAQAAATNVQAAYYTVRAPYAGWVAQVNVAVGDMAAPGLPLVALYDPAALRVAVQLPESVAARLDRTAPAIIELNNLPADAPAAVRRQSVAHINVLPAIDSATHSATVRIDLPAQPAFVKPGQFARVRFSLTSAQPAADSTRARVLVPRSAVVQRGELTAVYVVNAQGQAQLRQIRLGREDGELVEVLSGVATGEKVALDPVAAAQAAR